MFHVGTQGGGLIVAEIAIFPRQFADGGYYVPFPCGQLSRYFTYFAVVLVTDSQSFMAAVSAVIRIAILTRFVNVIFISVKYLVY